MSVGSNLRYWRQVRGLSRNELGKRASTTHAHIGNIERDESSPTIAMFLRLANALDVSVLELIGEDNQETAEEDGLTTVKLRVPAEKAEWFRGLAEYEISKYNYPLEAMNASSQRELAAAI